ncbi:DUF6445 family protein [Parachitinimonas caeni]|uniref:DUF6445 family protein n=1 Tax=Parachitinimonas caeni TaxID=3031301 RepID=A0ABT7DUD4_9NEIS|nr:DUF6445 family protein [Parachitinimonas caeni]MDK2123693.1 DUF6445 family protein [Parachitinimonas caeni]
MQPMPFPSTPLPPIPAVAPKLPYEPPRLGQNFWILENALPNPQEVVERCFNHDRWEYGLPYRPEKWPGWRFHDVLTPEELGGLEEWVKQVTGSRRLWVEQAGVGARVDCNVAQLVGGKDSGPRPHTDSRDLCRYAAVIYLHPDPPADSGTSFYRLRYPNGAIGGNLVPAPYRNLVDALGVSKLPPQAWHEELRIKNVFNRLLLYKANLVHSATAYFGEAERERRLTTVFFWMAE